MAEKTLSQRQIAALEFIKSFITRNGYPPTVRELADHMGYSSTSTAFNLLETLVRKGYVEKGPGPRMLRVINPNVGEVKIDGRSKQRIV